MATVERILHAPIAILITDHIGFVGGFFNNNIGIAVTGSSRLEYEPPQLFSIYCFHCELLIILYQISPGAII